MTFSAVAVLVLGVTSQPLDLGEEVIDAGAPEGPIASEVRVEPLAPSVDSKVTEQPQKTASPIAFLRWYDRLSIGGFARISLGYTVPLRDDQLIGGNGGFRVADFRLNLDFRPIEKLTVFASVELAAPLVNVDDPLTGRRIVELRDAYVQYDVCSGLLIRAGQFRPPYDAEMLASDGSIAFVGRSVLASGFSPPDGYGPRQPLAPDRQIGVQVGSRRFGGEASFGVKYALGVFNGAGPNQLFNDNNAVMPVARVELDYGQHVTLGLNGSYNVRTDGVRPNRLSTNSFNYGVDVQAHATVNEQHSLSALVTFLGRASTFSYAGLPAESALGVMGQARYLNKPTGLEAALRFAYYEPSSALVADDVTELAAMVGWRPFELPFRVLAQYTHRGEALGVVYGNDSLDVMLHAVW